jgi:hypothetical protein
MIENRTKSIITTGLVVVVTLVGVAAALSSSGVISSAFADPRYPPQEYHCYSNPHSDEKTGNPHDDGLNDKSNPHDGLRSDGGECVPR